MNLQSKIDDLYRVKDPNIADLIKQQIRKDVGLYYHAVIWDSKSDRQRLETDNEDNIVIKISTEWDHDHESNDFDIDKMIRDYSYIVNINISNRYILHTHIWDWFRENKFVGDFYWHVSTLSDRSCNVEFMFNDSNIATMFKMRWG